ncbi:hypothetical protein [Burkholderia gladioli]|uniref:hypothetical protein n=1 Tax=Burkholderia gladioli TaxID=28095 RepID=UPI001641776B|nr:hypothetical protein [Burkholderia gladioli]
MLVFNFGSLSVALGDPQFPPGQLVVSSVVTELEKRGRLFAALYLRRHLNGDWGDADEALQKANAIGVRNGRRLISLYRIAFDITLRITTEADRSMTLIQLDGEASDASRPMS